MLESELKLMTGWLVVVWWYVAGKFSSCRVVGYLIQVSFSIDQKLRYQAANQNLYLPFQSSLVVPHKRGSIYYQQYMIIK